MNSLSRDLLMTLGREVDLLERVYQQGMGDHLLKSIRDDEMVQVYLSAGLLREIAEVCNPIPATSPTAG